MAGGRLEASLGPIQVNSSGAGEGRRAVGEGAVKSCLKRDYKEATQYVSFLEVLSQTSPLALVIQIKKSKTV